MKYYVTIYVDKLFGEITRNFEVLKLNFFFLYFTHAFLGLTHTHLDELDSLGDIELEKYSNPQYDSFIGCYFNTIKKDKGK